MFDLDDIIKAFTIESLRMAFCRHKWAYFKEPTDEETVLCCIKCGKSRHKKVNPKKMVDREYLWCKCGRDLATINPIEEINDKEIEITCRICKEKTIVDKDKYSNLLKDKDQY